MSLSGALRCFLALALLILPLLGFPSAGALAQTLPVVTISGGSAVVEGTPTGFFVNLSQASTQQITVNLQFTDAPGADFVTVTPPLSAVFLPGSTQTLVQVTTVNDNVDEPSGPIMLKALPGTGYTVGSPDTGSIHVADNDGTAGFDISVNSLTIDEEGSATFTVALETVPSGTVTVQPTSDNGDVSVSPPLLVFSTSNWYVPQEVTVGAVSDDDTTNDTATISLSGSGSDYNGVIGNVGVTVNDVVPVLTASGITQTGATLTLGNHSGAWYYRRIAPHPSGACTGPVTGTVTLTGLTAGRSYQWIAYSDSSCGTELDGVTFTTLAATNAAPTVQNAIPDQTATVGTPFSYPFPANTFSDADTGDTLTYTATKGDDSSLPSWLTFSGGTRTFSGTPTAGDTGTLTVKVTADDGNGGTVSDEFDITVSMPANRPPTVANALDDETATVGAAFTYRFPTTTFNDPDGHSLTYAARKSDGSALPSWLTFNAGNRTFSGTPAAGDTGTVTVRVTANDGNGRTVTDDFDIVVSAATGTSSILKIETLGNPPVETTSFTINEGESGNVFQVSLKEIPPNDFVRVSVYLGPTTGSAHTSRDFYRSNYNVRQPVRLQIEEDDDYDDETLTITLRLASGQNRNNPRFHGPQETVTVTVLDNDTRPADLPTVTITGGGSAVTEGTAASFTVSRTGDTTSALTVLLSVSEPNNQDFVASGDEGDQSVMIPSGSTSQTYTVATTPDSTDEPNGQVTVSLRTSSSYTSGSPSTASVAVNDDDDPPQNNAPTVANMIPDRMATAGMPFSYQFPETTFSDTDGDSFTYMTTQLPSWLSFNTNTRTFSGTPPAAATVTVGVTASDGKGGSVTDSFDITVGTAPVNADPTVAINIPDRTATAGTAFSYTFPTNTFADANSDSLTYMARRSDGTALPSWLTFNAGNRTFSGTPASGDTGTVTVRVTASDGNGGTVSDDFVITVSAPTPPTPPTPPSTGTGGTPPPPPSLPVISVSGTKEATEGETLMFTISSVSTVTQDTEITISVEQSGDHAEPHDTGEKKVTIEAGRTEAVYEVRTTQDSVDEEDGTVTVTVLPGNGYETNTQIFTTQVKDDDTAGIRVSAASVRIQGDGSSASYTVVLSSEPTSEVRVEPRASDEGVAVTSGTLVFSPEDWNEEKTVTVKGYSPGETTIEHEVFSEDSSYANLREKPSLEVNVMDRSRVEGAGQWLGRFGRTVAERVVDTVSGRLNTDRQSSVEIAGGPTAKKSNNTLWEEEERESLPVGEVLLGSSFNAGRRDSAVFWARGSRVSFEGSTDNFRGDGEVTMGMGGVDWDGGNWLGGIMIVRAEGDGEYSENKVDAYLTGAVPYMGIRVTEHLSVWATAGAGTGEMKVDSENGREVGTDIGWRMAAGGIRGDIVVPETEGFGLAAVLDVLYSRSESEDTDDMGTSRARAGLEGMWTARLSDKTLFRPRLEAGIRRDGGDAERGFGGEFGGGMMFVHSGIGITVDVGGRGLVSHEDGGFETRGVSMSLEWERDMRRGRGASLAVRRKWGEPESGGMESLFYDGPIRGVGVTGGGSLSAGAEYGFEREGVMQTPYVDYGWREEGRDYRVGLRVSSLRGGVSVDLNATRSESEETEHGVGLRVGRKW